jgi:hypothetical protein
MNLSDIKLSNYDIKLSNYDIKLSNYDFNFLKLPSLMQINEDNYYQNKIKIEIIDINKNYKEIENSKILKYNIYFIYFYIKKITNNFANASQRLDILKYISQDICNYIIYHIFNNIDLYKTIILDLLNCICDNFNILLNLDISIIIIIYNTILFENEDEEITCLDYIAQKYNILIFNIKEISPYSEDINEIEKIIEIFVTKFTNKTIIFFDDNSISKIIIYKNNILQIEKKIPDLLIHDDYYYNLLLQYQKFKEFKSINLNIKYAKYNYCEQNYYNLLLKKLNLEYYNENYIIFNDNELMKIFYNLDNKIYWSRISNIIQDNKCKINCDIKPKDIKYLSI